MRASPLIPRFADLLPRGEKALPIEGRVLEDATRYKAMRAFPYGNIVQKIASRVESGEETDAASLLSKLVLIVNIIGCRCDNGF